MGDLTDEKILAYIDNSIEHTRPYIGEYIWAVYFCYRALFLRLLTLLQRGQQDASKMDWHRDGGIRQLMTAVLNASRN